MLALFAVGLLVRERTSPCFLFWTTIYIVCSPECVADIYGSLQHELSRQARIAVHQGKTQLWNRHGVMSSGCEAMTAAARVEDDDAVVWKGDPDLPTVAQGIRLLGTPFGQVDDVAQSVAEAH